MSESENRDDERLIWSRFLKGDRQVLSLIYLQHYNALFDYGCRLNADRELVKDCIQEVFCTLIRTRKNLCETDNVKLYLMKSVKRKMIRELEKSNHQSRIETDQEYPFDLRWAENMSDPLNEMEEEKKQLVTEALQSLTERQKEAIYLRFNRGLDYEEISFILNVNYQSSRALIHRTIEKLREIILVPNKKIEHLLLFVFHRNGNTVTPLHGV